MNKFANDLLRQSWIVLLAAFYALVYSHSLTFVYNEGDDATSIAYHLLGRRPAFQPAYSAYQGMMDFVLSGLPPQEPLLRMISIVVTSLAAVSFTFLMLKLVFDWTREVPPQKKWFITLIVLLAIPELFYLGIVYSPTLIAISLILGSHLLVRKVTRDKEVPGFSNYKDNALILWSLILFGIGVAFRWNTIAYGAVIVVDIFLRQGFGSIKKWVTRKKLIFGVSWGLLALFFSLAAIVLSGYRISSSSGYFESMMMVLNQVGGSDSYLSMILIFTPLFTPGFFILSITGFIVLVQRRSSLWVVVAVGLMGVVPWLRSGTPKFIITAIPGLVLCFVVGLIFIWDGIRSNGLKKIFRMAILVIIIAPWVIGIRAAQSETAWGPGFELRPFNRGEIGGTQIGLTLGSGAAFPTPEGPRPLLGYLYNLIGETHKNFILERSNERHDAVDIALSQNLPLVITGWSPDYFLDDLYSRGFTTDDPSQRMLPDNPYFKERRFLNTGGQSIRLLYYEIVIKVNSEEIIRPLSGLKDVSNKAVLFGNPRSMRSLYLSCPGVLDPIGPVTAILDLGKLSTRECLLNQTSFLNKK